MILVVQITDQLVVEGRDRQPFQVYEIVAVVIKYIRYYLVSILVWIILTLSRFGFSGELGDKILISYYFGRAVKAYKRGRLRDAQRDFDQLIKVSENHASLASDPYVERGRELRLEIENKLNIGGLT